VEATTSNISLSTLQNALAGRYAFERELGRGGMATVYLARDLTHNRYVAVKVLLPELAVTLGMERFLREIDVGTALQHPRIVGVLDSGSADGVLYYVMPFVEGMSLRDRLNREKQLPVDDTISIAKQVADALAYAHSKGVIHRDIKPENILLDEHGAMVADFGIARAVSVAGGETLTKTGMAVGTPTYMSPEQAMGSKDVTPESDIYSLACVVYEMLAGQPPFTGPTAMALLARHSLDNVPSLKIVRGTVPDAVEDAIVRAMAKVPADRFRNANDFAAALTDNEGAARRRQDSLRAKAIAAETVERSALGKRSKTPIIVGAAVALLLAAGGGWYALRGRTATPPAGLSGDFAKKNIAVMYFEDRSPKKELGYLADGLTESLIDELSAVPQLKVASRNGSATFKGKVVPSDSIARTLKVGTVVNGTIEPAGDGKVRVVVRVDDAQTGSQIDKTQIEQSLGNSLALQDTIARQVSLFLRKRVGQEIQAITSRIGTSNAAAWEALQRARQTVAEVDALVADRHIPEAKAKVVEADSALAKVEALDAKWRTPIIDRGWLAYTAALRIIRSGPDYGTTIDRGLAQADRALKIAPNDPEALELRGALHYLQWLTNLAPNPDAAAALLTSAEQDLTTATTGVSQPARAYNLLSHLRINKGELPDAKFAAENAYKLDPFLTNVDATILRLFLASLDMQMADEAQKWCTELRTRFPQSYRSVECKLWLYALPAEKKPDMAEVWRTYDEYVKVSPANLQEFDKLKGKMMVGIAYLRAGMPDSAKAIAASSQGDPSVDPRGETVNLAAIIYAQAGDKDKAIGLAKRWFAANPNQRATAANDNAWWFKDIRDDPRYKALIKSSN
jgi:TolB-like protein/tetratricopeptide (TPR) repeat protein